MINKEAIDLMPQGTIIINTARGGLVDEAALRAALESGKVYAAGLFATHLLNQYYLNDTAARIAVFSDEVNNNIVRQLENGYLNISEFVSTGRNVLEAMKSLPKLHPFDTLDNSAITDCVTNLFTEANGERICTYFSEKAKVSVLPQDEVAVGTAYRYAERTDKEAGVLIHDAITILQFFNNVSTDLISAHDKLTAFVERIDEVELAAFLVDEKRCFQDIRVRTDPLINEAGEITANLRSGHFVKARKDINDLASDLREQDRPIADDPLGCIR